MTLFFNYVLIYMQKKSSSCFSRVSRVHQDCSWQPYSSTSTLGTSPREWSDIKKGYEPFRGYQVSWSVENTLRQLRDSETDVDANTMMLQGRLPVRRTSPHIFRNLKIASLRTARRWEVKTVYETGPKMANPSYTEKETLWLTVLFRNSRATL